MDTTIPMQNVLSQIMDASALRHRVISQNVANVNTPGYRRLEVQFEDEFAKALVAADGGAPSHVSPKVVLGEGPERVDGNNVDIDVEMNLMAKNALLYEAATQILASRVSSMRSAITGQ